MFLKSNNCSLLWTSHFVHPLFVFFWMTPSFTKNSFVLKKKTMPIFSGPGEGFIGYFRKLLWYAKHWLEIWYILISFSKSIRKWPERDCKGKIKGGICWKLITLALYRDPWKLYLMFLFREIDIQLCQIYTKINIYTILYKSSRFKQIIFSK